MSPFGDYRHVVPANARRHSSGQCAVRRSQPTQLREEFDAVVRQSWSLAEIDILSQAADAALL
jgi:hypothetical protein